MDLVDYYEDGLGADILALSSASGGDFSIVAFVDPKGPAYGGRVQRVFFDWAIERQVAFLLGFHFCVLLDQAIHEGVRPQHATFATVAGYPKLRGILASAHMNMHPALLLGVASALVHEESIDQTTDEFRRLSDHVVTEYARFLVDDFADLTGTTRGTSATKMLLAPVFSSLSSAYALLFRPSASATSFPFRGSASPPRPEVYATWCGIVQADIHRVGEAAGAWQK